MDILPFVLAIFLPPLAVFPAVNLGLHFRVSIPRTILGCIPDMIHALRVIVKKEEKQDCFVSTQYYNFTRTRNEKLWHCF